MTVSAAAGATRPNGGGETFWPLNRTVLPARLGLSWNFTSTPSGAAQVISTMFSPVIFHETDTGPFTVAVVPRAQDKPDKCGLTVTVVAAGLVGLMPSTIRLRK